MEERLAGFDAREMWSDFHSDWSEQRKQGFLYRLDITKPLSADTQVWPSIFDFYPVPKTVNRFGYQTTWANLADLRRAITATYKDRPLEPFYLIAISLFLGDYSKNDPVDWDSLIPPTKPERRSSTWAFLGYDVGDTWMLGAISNCGFLPRLDDVKTLRQQWGPRLNKYHLFDDLDAAIAFKQMSDERLKDDHAPCFVFGLWQIK